MSGADKDATSPAMQLATPPEVVANKRPRSDPEFEPDPESLGFSVTEPVGEWYLAVHCDDEALIRSKELLPMRLYGATNKSYLGLRETGLGAVERLETFLKGRATFDRRDIRVLRFQFSAQGFAKYALQSRTGTADAWAPMLHKMLYKQGDIDWQAWAFHGDLPLHEISEDGHVLLSSQWLTLSDSIL